MKCVERTKWGVEVAKRTKKPCALQVAAFLVDKTNSETGQSWYSKASMAKELQICEKSVKNGYNELKEIGLLDIEYSAKGNRADKMTNLFALKMLEGNKHSPRDENYES